MSGGAAEIGGLAGGPHPAGGPYRGWVVAVVCGVLPAALLAVIVAVPAALWSRLPGRIADHWTLAGTANGTAPRLVPFLLMGVIALAGAGIVAAGWARARRAAGGPPRRRAAVAGTATATTAVGLFMTAEGAASVVMIALANLGGGGLRSASVGAGGMPEMIAGPVLLAALASFVLRRYGGLGVADDGAPRSSVGLRPGERAVWTGRARAGWPWPAGTLLVAAGVIAGVVAGQWGLAVVLLVAGGAMFLHTSVRVTVTARGVAVAYGPLGLRLTRIPLRRIASAAAVERAGGGFGYRGSLLVFGAAAVILRRGPALRLTLTNGKFFLVTVDDAATGAALLNDLIARAQAHEPGTGW